jgi:hypothetical protein
MMDRLVLLLLAAGCVLFGAIVYVELEPDDAADAAVARVAARPETAAVVHRQPGGAARLDELVATALARPLFSSTRRPPQSAAAGAAPDGDLADKRLTGIVITPGQRIAIFAIAGDKPLRVSEGEELSGWHIDNISLREVSLSGPGGTKVLQPKLDPSLVPPPAPAVVANTAGRPPILPPGTRVPGSLPAPAAGQPNPVVPPNIPNLPPRPARLRQQR